MDPAPTPSARRRAVASAAAVVPAAEPHDSGAALPAPSSRPPEFPWRYLGRFGSLEKKIAVFSDGRRQLDALEGDVIDGRFLVARIGRESVDIEFVGFPAWPGQRLGVRRR